MKKLLVSSLTLILSLTSTSILAQQNMNNDMKNMEKKAETSKQPAMHSATGTVTKVDASNKRVTLAHEPVQSLNWPAMTMGFIVDDEELLNKLNVGETLEFEFIKADKGYVITDVK